MLIIVVAFMVIGFSLIQLVGEYLFTQRSRDDQRIADTLAEQLSDCLVSFDAQTMYLQATETAEAEENSRVLVLDKNCVVQMDTDAALNGTRFITAEVDHVLAGAESDYGYYDLGGTGSFWVRAALNTFSNVNSMSGFYASGMYDDGALVGVLVYVSHVQEIYESLRDIQLKIIFWLVLVATLVFFINLLITRTFTRPIGELNEGIARMSRGDLSVQVKVRGKNEFAQLAAAFNSMSERLARLDQARSQFVSNASHELKTPLSTMKILVESLVYQDPLDPGMAREFLGDIDKEIDRLNRIVSDLLTLVNIDSGTMKLKLVSLNLSDLLQEQVKRLSPLARENGIELDCAVKESVEVMGDTLKLQQVIYNVIDNAIKYTGRGGEVRCSLVRTGRKAVIRVADTGVGIPEADLPHIFDRFYRVDKARSRETGGTGLGLSIVKQTLQMLGGDIEAQSVFGKGSTFIITMPIASARQEE